MKKTITPVKLFQNTVKLLVLFFVMFFLAFFIGLNRDGWKSYQKSDLVTYHNQLIQVTNVKDYIYKNEKNGITPTKTGQRIIQVNLLLENISKKTNYFWSPKLIDSDGHEYEDSFILDSEFSFNSELQPNIKVEKSVSYKVPPTARGFKLKFTQTLSLSSATIGL